MTHCKDCLSENIKRYVEDNVIIHKGMELTVPVHFSVCQDCEREFVPKEQILQNEAVVRKAKKLGQGHSPNNSKSDVHGMPAC